jgi:hypothetical protein
MACLPALNSSAKRTDHTIELASREAPARVLF